MQLFVPAGTYADAELVRLLDYGRGLFVIQYLDVFCRIDCFLIGQRPQGRYLLAAFEVCAVEGVLILQVIGKEPGPFFGVQLAPGPHHGELEDSDHHGRGGVMILAFHPEIHDQPLGCQIVENLLEF